MLLLFRRCFVLYEDKINVNVPSVAIYSTDHIKLGAVEALEALEN